MKRAFVVFLLGISPVLAQMSHAQLTWELLQDMNRAVADSIHLASGTYQLEFAEDTELADYLKMLYTGNTSFEGDDGGIVTVNVQKLTMTIDHAEEKIPRNKPYRRRLKLSTQIDYAEKHFIWEGNTSDQLTAAGLESLLSEDYPTKISGNYLDEQPGKVGIILGTLGLFGMLAALFFIRT